MPRWWVQEKTRRLTPSAAKVPITVALKVASIFLLGPRTRRRLTKAKTTVRKLKIPMMCSPLLCRSRVTARMKRRALTITLVRAQAPAFPIVTRRMKITSQATVTRTVSRL